MIRLISMLLLQMWNHFLCKQQFYSHLLRIIDLYVIPKQFNMSHIQQGMPKRTCTPQTSRYSTSVLQEHAFGPIITPQRQHLLGDVVIEIEPQLKLKE